MDRHRSENFSKHQPSAKHSFHPLILLIEDDDDQMLLFKTKLQMLGHDVVTAHTGGEALDILEELYVDLVVCDVMLPEMSGKELVKRVRESRRHNGLPVIAVTAGADILKNELLDCGADEFLYKRDAAANLGEAIERLLHLEETTEDLLIRILHRYR